MNNIMHVLSQTSWYYIALYNMKIHVPYPENILEQSSCLFFPPLCKNKQVGGFGQLLSNVKGEV